MNAHFLTTSKTLAGFVSHNVVYRNITNMCAKMSGIVEEFGEDHNKIDLEDLQKDSEAICMFFDTILNLLNKPIGCTRIAVIKRFGLPHILPKDADKRLIQLEFKKEDVFVYPKGWIERECRKISELGIQNWLWDDWNQTSKGSFEPKGLWPEGIESRVEEFVNSKHTLHERMESSWGTCARIMATEKMAREKFKKESDEFLKKIEPKVFKLKGTHQPA